MLTLSEAAEQLGISRAALDNWIKRLGIEKKKEGRIGLTAKEVEQIRKQRCTNSRRRYTNTTATNSSSVVSAFVEQELKELKQIVTSSSLSLNDKERMDIIDRVYKEVKEYHSLVRYYTNKNISVSILRAKKQNNTKRVLDLYGTPNQKYW